MILKALYDYYQRMGGQLAPEGFDDKEIAFVIAIDEEGNFIRVEDQRKDKKHCNKFRVVKGIRSGITPKPYQFWDNVEYTLGYSKDCEPLNDEDAENSEKIKKRDKALLSAKSKHAAFVENCRSVSKNYPNDVEFNAVVKFYDNDGVNKLQESEWWNEFLKSPTVNVSFVLNGKKSIVAERSELLVKSDGDADLDKESNEAICLITGEKSAPVLSSSPTPIPGGQATGRLVSFQINSGYDSYGKSKGNNAPISRKAEAAYTTALNKLLAKDSKNRFIIGNRTFVFWTSSVNEASRSAEEELYSFLGLSKDEDDDPNARIDKVRKVFNAIYSGDLHSDDDDKFFILGLAPNSAREAVVYWNECSVKSFAGKILKHFKDMEIIDTHKDKKPYYGLYNILSAVTLKGKTQDVQPNLPEALMKSIFEGMPYPFALYMACINRIRAEQQLNITRAAIIKAYLLRLNDNNIKLNVMLDKENLNQGYLCGRLFATLEYLQGRSSNNTTIRSRYMNAASATPVAVFPTLLNLSVHHEDKLEGKGSQVFFENLKGEIIDKISTKGFPEHLDLKDQGLFMIGYYQQMQDFYTSKKYKNEENS